MSRTHERISEAGKYSHAAPNLTRKRRIFPHIVLFRITVKLWRLNWWKSSVPVLSIDKLLKRMSRPAAMAQPSRTYPPSTISAPTANITAGATSWWTGSSIRWITAIEYPHRALRAINHRRSRGSFRGTSR